MPILNMVLKFQHLSTEKYFKRSLTSTILQNIFVCIGYIMCNFSRFIHSNPLRFNNWPKPFSCQTNVRFCTQQKQTWKHNHMISTVCNIKNVLYYINAQYTMPVFMKFNFEEQVYCCKMIKLYVTDIFIPNTGMDKKYPKIESYKHI